MNWHYRARLSLYTATTRAVSMSAWACIGSRTHSEASRQGRSVQQSHDLDQGLLGQLDQSILSIRTGDLIWLDLARRRVDRISRSRWSWWLSGRFRSLGPTQQDLDHVHVGQMLVRRVKC